MTSLFSPKWGFRPVVFAGLALAGTAVPSAWSQASATATSGIALSAFGGLSGVYTGIGLGRNLGLTAGVDVTIHPFFGLFPSAEIRGTYPVDKGNVDGEKNFLAGLVLSRHLGRLQPYGDILAGRGEIDFPNPYPNPARTIAYTQTASGVISPGAGVNFFVSPRLGGKADFQFERYESPVTTSGVVYAKVFTLGVVYRFGGGLGHGNR